ncbi:MAG TPA: ACT domain-containing protein [Planktothrix sp.]|jgi:glycine cleavage system transcriptional repressor
MKKQVLVTAVGEDRPGIVAKLTEVLVKHGANLEESRMSVLGGEFAAISLVTVPEEKMASLEKDLAELKSHTISVTTKHTKALDPKRFSEHTCLQIDLSGADHEGIVHKVSAFLRDRDINIQSMDTDVVHAPETGTPLFRMKGLIQVPAKLKQADLQKSLDEIGNSESVEISLTKAASEQANALLGAGSNR